MITKVCQSNIQPNWCFASAIKECFNKFISIFQRSKIEINTDTSTKNLRLIYNALGDLKWKEGIDGEYHHLGKRVFDKGLHGGTIEPGYYSSIKKAQRFIDKTMKKKVDASWYLQLHKNIASHFNGKKNGVLMGQEKVGVFRGKGDHLSCKYNGYSKLTHAARRDFYLLDQELSSKYGENYGLGEIVKRKGWFSGYKIRYMEMPQNRIEKLFNHLMRNFQKEVKSSKNADNKLLAIARLHRSLEWLHPVRDGSTRTNLALINKLLTENGFHPFLTYNPNAAASWSANDWKKELVKGMIAWEQEKLRN